MLKNKIGALSIAIIAGLVITGIFVLMYQFQIANSTIVYQLLTIPYLLSAIGGVLILGGDLGLTGKEPYGGQAALSTVTFILMPLLFAVVIFVIIKVISFIKRMINRKKSTLPPSNTPNTLQQ